MSLPDDRRYSLDHIWAKLDGPHLIVGITDHAQDALGTVETANLPAVGQQIDGGQVCGCLESVKTVSDIIAPIAATVVEHNAAVADDPALINDDPYDDGWLMRLEQFSPDAYHSLLDASDYASSVET